jgi:hypothetical protein
MADKEVKLKTVRPSVTISLRRVRDAVEGGYYG